MRVQVEVFASFGDFAEDNSFRNYTMNHDDPHERRVLGEQCRNAFEGGQVIVTYRVDNFGRPK